MFVFDRSHLDELGRIAFPLFEHPASYEAVGVTDVRRDQSMELLPVVRRCPAGSVRPSPCCSNSRNLRAGSRRRRCRRSCRPRSCARSVRARPHDLRSCIRSRGRPPPSTTAVAPLLRTQKRSPTRPVDVGFAARRTVEQGVPGNDVTFGREARPGGRNDDDPAA